MPSLLRVGLPAPRSGRPNKLFIMVTNEKKQSRVYPFPREIDQFTMAVPNAGVLHDLINEPLTYIHSLGKAAFVLLLEAQEKELFLEAGDVDNMMLLHASLVELWELQSAALDITIKEEVKLEVEEVSYA